MTIMPGRGRSDTEHRPVALAPAQVPGSSTSISARAQPDTRPVSSSSFYVT
jgi:hypothetical protein